MLKALRQRLARFFKKAPGNPHTQRPVHWPTREEITRHPPFRAVHFDKITEVDTPSAARQAQRQPDDRAE